MPSLRSAGKRLNRSLRSRWKTRRGTRKGSSGRCWVTGRPRSSMEPSVTGFSLSAGMPRCSIGIVRGCSPRVLAKTPGLPALTISTTFASRSGEPGTMSARFHSSRYFNSQPREGRMGADLYIHSSFDKAQKKYGPRFEEFVRKRDTTTNGRKEYYQGKVVEYFD